MGQNKELNCDSQYIIGGIDIPDIKTHIKALKLAWLRNLYQNKPNWSKILQAICPEIDSLKTYGPSMLTARKVNPFWINVFQAYENLSDRVDLNSASELLIKPLLLNNKVKINNKKRCFILKSGQVRTYFLSKLFWKKMRTFLMFKNSINNMIRVQF